MQNKTKHKTQNKIKTQNKKNIWIEVKLKIFKNIFEESLQFN